MLGVQAQKGRAQRAVGLLAEAPEVGEAGEEGAGDRGGDGEVGLGEVGEGEEKGDGGGDEEEHCGREGWSTKHSRDFDSRSMFRRRREKGSISKANTRCERGEQGVSKKDIAD